MKTTRRWLGMVVTSAVVLASGEPHVAKAAASAEGPEAPSATETSPQGTPTKVLVLPVQVSGELPPDTAAEMATLVADNLADEGITVMRGDAVGATCDETCRRAAAEAAGAELLVGARVEGEDDEYAVTVALFAGDTGEELAAFADECSICGFVEVRDMVRLRALDARADVLRRRSAVAVEEPGPIVAAPTDRPLAPRSKLVPAGWGLVGAGAAATVGGVVLLALHHRSAGCLDNPRGGDCVPLRYTTAPAGGAVLGAGVAAVVGGVVMVVLGRRAEQRAEGKRVAVLPHGTGLRLRF